MENIFTALRTDRRERELARKVQQETGKSPVWKEPAFLECPKCNRRATRAHWAESLYVCPNCGHYLPIGGYYRLSLVLDHGSFRELNEKLEPGDPLSFPGYKEKLAASRRKTGLNEAVVTATGKIDEIPVVVAVLDSRFFMGSMSAAVGEKITLAVEYAISKKLPLIIFSASGGARMQEGILSLMQMAKTSGAVKRHSDAGNLYVTFLTDPTTGGVSASFAMDGDIILAEPGALIGFAGPRVIEQTIRQKLPDGFQRAEFLLEKGFVDDIVERPRQKEYLSHLLELHQPFVKHAGEEEQDGSL